MARYLITGANRGIGLELTRQLAGRGEEVLACCRRSGEALEATGAEVIEGIEVSDDASLARLVSAVGDRRLDVLVNCAGVLTRESLDDLDLDRIRRQFEINTLGPLRVTHALLDRLGPGSKVAIISSRMGSIEDNGSGGLYGYRLSKCAVNMVGRSLAHDLHDRDICVFLLHPGMVATEMTGRNGIPVDESARGLIERMDSLGIAESGQFWHADGESLPW